MDCNLGQNSKTRKVYDQQFSVHFSSKGERFEPTIVCYNKEGHVLEVRTDRQTDRQIDKERFGSGKTIKPFVHSRRGDRLDKILVAGLRWWQRDVIDST